MNEIYGVAKALGHFREKIGSRYISLIQLSPDLALKSRNHTHGIPKMPDEAGPRISVAFLLGAS